MELLERLRISVDESVDIRDDLSAGINVTLHFILLGGLAWGSGQPFLFPSLGPSAYLLATGEKPRAEGAYHVVGGHAVAAVCGLIAYLVFADGLVVTEAFEQGERFSSEVGLLVVSGVVSMVLTTIGMLWTNTNHPAACATTLIVALGLMSTAVEVGIIVVAVTILVWVHGRIVERVQTVCGVEPKDPR
ncbi:HPP family protein [Natronolimnohabitans sp. A-GB9]|uniref:HPP family protein n=1 Tax=Natronolimnohabitans sp. A-GB9 TaxID=3069757 RepID=UPI0027B0DEC0|nr:HPP family protein [Natronolimnohabitans sp. A-GB9]MDQ2050094.1 HPP family protein [Natronolimnohabitans sp. A-GB9]